MVLTTVILTRTQILAEFAIVLFNISVPNDAKETSLADHVNEQKKNP